MHLKTPSRGIYHAKLRKFTKFICLSLCMYFSNFFHIQNKDWKASQIDVSGVRTTKTVPKNGYSRPLDIDSGSVRSPELTPKSLMKMESFYDNRSPGRDQKFRGNPKNLRGTSPLTLDVSPSVSPSSVHETPTLVRVRSHGLIDITPPFNVNEMQKRDLDRKVYFAKALKRNPHLLSLLHRTKPLKSLEGYTWYVFIVSR